MLSSVAFVCTGCRVKVNKNLYLETPTYFDPSIRKQTHTSLKVKQVVARIVTKSLDNFYPVAHLWKLIPKFRHQLYNFVSRSVSWERLYSRLDQWVTTACVRVTFDWKKLNGLLLFYSADPSLFALACFTCVQVTVCLDSVEFWWHWFVHRIGA